MEQGLQNIDWKKSNGVLRIKKGLKYLLCCCTLMCFMSPVFSQNEINLATEAEAYASAPYLWHQINDGYINSDCNTQEAILWTQVGSSWMIWDWGNEQKVIDKIRFYNASRPFTGGTIQKWDGSQWVDVHTFTRSAGCEYTVEFSPVKTRKLRITDLQVGFYPNFREIEIYKATPSNSNNAAATSINNPHVFCSGNQGIQVKISNLGTNVINNVTVNWTFNGNLQAPVNINGPLDTVGGNAPYSQDTVITLGTQNFPAGQMQNIQVWTSNPNGMADGNPQNDTVIRNIQPALSGTYSLGGGSADFASMSAAAKDLVNYGICGQVTFNIQAGTYTDSVQITRIPRAQNVNDRVIFQGDDSSNTIITGSPSGNQKSTIVLAGTDYVTFRDLKIETTASEEAAALHLIDSANHNSITNCWLSAPVSANNDDNPVFLLNGAINDIGRSGVSHGNTIQNSYINGGSIGIRMYGTLFDVPAIAKNNSIKNNIIEGASDEEVSLEAVDSTIVMNNTINNDDGSAAFFGGNMGYFEIVGNHVKSNEEAMSFQGGNIRPDSGALLANNIIHTTSKGDPALYITYSFNFDGATDIHIHHNTIVGNPAIEFDPYGWMSNFPATQIDLRNNILFSTHEHALYAEFTQFSHMDHNIYFAPGSSFILYDETNYSSLSQLKSDHPDFNQSSVDYAPGFVSNSNLHLDDSKKVLRGAYVGIDKDIDGDSRCKLGGTVGADESEYVGQVNASFELPDTVYVNSSYTLRNNGDRGGFKYRWYRNGNYQDDTFSLTTRFNSTGQHSISLVSEGCNGYDSVTMNTTVISPSNGPVTNFIADNPVIMVNDVVSFEDLSQNGPTDWDWDVNPKGNLVNPFYYDNSDTVPDARIGFIEPGHYEICLTTSNSAGSNTLCRERYIKVARAMCQGTNVTDSINGTITDDGGVYNNYSNSQSCNYLINPCIDSIKVTIDDIQLENGSDYLRIYNGTSANGKPLWDTNKYGMNGLTGNLDNQDIDSIMMASSGAVYVEFESDGGFTDDGFVLSWDGMGAYSNQKPAADFSGPDSICTGTTANFMSTSMGPISEEDHVSYRWHVDNILGGGISVSKQFSYTFSSAGNHEVILLVENCAGIDTMRKNVAVLPQGNPIPKFTANNKNPWINTGIAEFFSTSLYCTNSYEWSFSPSSVEFINGTDSMSENPQVVFKDTGCYDVTLTVGNSQGTSNITKSCFINVKDGCEPSVDNLVKTIGFNRVRFAGIDNESKSGQIAYYPYLNAASVSTDVQLGTEYDIILNRDITTDPMNVKVWADWNADGDFSDAGEMVYQAGSSYKGEWRGSIEIPTSAELGYTRLRVGGSYGSDPNTACGTNNYGEFEDYRINIVKDQMAPDLSLNGPDTVNLEACESLNNPSIGATAMDNKDGNVTGMISRSGNVDTTQPGIYELWYSVADANGNEDSTVQHIKVTPDVTKPSISLQGQDPATVILGDTYTEMGYNASDNCTGIMKVETERPDTSIVDTVMLDYTAYDNNGNRSTATRTVYVVDTTSPSVSYASDTVTIEVYSKLNIKMTVSDNYYSNMDLSMSTGGGFYSNFLDGMADSLGVFEATYQYVDPSGNSSSSTVYVEVVDTEAPEISLMGRGVVNLERWALYQEEGVNVSDNYDQDPDTLIGGTYFTEYISDSFPPGGMYEITYQAEDQSGNRSETVRRTINITSPTGISSQEGSRMTRIYPNPSTGIFTLELKLEKEKDVEVEILNSLGKVVRKEDPGNIANHTFNLNLESEGAGVYMIRIKHGNEVTMKQITLTR